MANYELGSKIQVHANFDYESNCALCAKPLGQNFAEVTVDENNRVISANDYSTIANNGGFVATLPIGSTCVNQVVKEGVAA